MAELSCLEWNQPWESDPAVARVSAKHVSRVGSLVQRRQTLGLENLRYRKNNQVQNWANYVFLLLLVYTHIRTCTRTRTELHFIVYHLL